MSKQSEAKLKQNYNPKPLPRVCMNCENYKSEMIEYKNVFSSYVEEKNKRCGIGGFAVKKGGTCDLFEAKKCQNK